jgi:hypothetical protein
VLNTVIIDTLQDIGDLRKLRPNRIYFGQQLRRALSVFFEVGEKILPTVLIGWGDFRRLRRRVAERTDSLGNPPSVFTFIGGHGIQFFAKLRVRQSLRVEFQLLRMMRFIKITLGQYFMDVFPPIRAKSNNGRSAFRQFFRVAIAPTLFRERPGKPELKISSKGHAMRARTGANGRSDYS